MIKKFLAIVIFFYILALLQTSFLVHFNIFSGWLVGYGLILAMIILINLFIPRQRFYGLETAFIGGFFWDIFSNRPIGVSILILVLLAFFINFILKRYVQIPLAQRV